jgi:benzodiazapine receptor
VRRYLFAFGTLLVITSNAAASLIPLNGYATGQLSDMYPTGFTPPGWVFSIWSIIYVGLIGLSVRAVRAGGRGSSGLGNRARARLDSIEWPYLVSSIANAGWIFAWHYRQVALSVVVMLVLLASLAVAWARLRRQPASSLGERVFVDGTISLYFGWITAATFINIATLFFDLGRYPFGLAMNEWAIVAVVVATAVYVAFGAWTSDAVYTAVFVWASFGIASNAKGITDAVQLAAAAGCAAAACVVVVAALRSLTGRTRRA